MYDLKSIIANGKTVKFKQYRQNTLYYETAEGFIFAVPAVEIGDSCLQAEEKASLFMKWIRRALDEIKD